MKKIEIIKVYNVEILALISIAFIFAISWKISWAIETIETLPKMIAYITAFYIAVVTTVAYVFLFRGIMRKSWGRLIV